MRNVNVKISHLQRGRVSVYCPDIAAPVRLIITRRASRQWALEHSTWTGGKWDTQGTIGTYPSQAVALFHAGAWFETLALMTSTPPAGVCIICGGDGGGLNAAGLCQQCAGPPAGGGG